MPLKAIRFATDHDGVYTTSIGSHAPNAQTWLIFVRYRATRIGLGRQMCLIDMDDANGTANYFLCPESTFNSDSVESHDFSLGGFNITANPFGAGQWWCIAETNDFSVTTTILYSQRVGYPGAMTQTQDGNHHASFTTMQRLIVGTDDAQGVPNTPQNEWLDGDIAGIKIWDHALTAAELEKEKTQLYPVKTTGLKFFYDFQDLVTGLQDKSGNGLGTLSDIQGTFGFPSGTPGRTLVNDGPDIPYHPVTASGGASTVANVGLGLFDPSLVPLAIPDPDFDGKLPFISDDFADIANPSSRNAGVTQAGVGPLGFFLDEFFRDDQPQGYYDDDYVIQMNPPSGTVYTANVSETVTLSEAISVQANFIQGLPETVALSEALAIQAIFSIGPSETVTLSEALAVIASYVIGLPETVTLSSETVVVQAVFAPNLPETVVLSEALAIVAEYLVNLSETVALSEQVSQFVSLPVALAETVTLSEQLDTLYLAIVGLPETVALSEALATLATFSVNLSETVTLSEALQAGILYQLGLSENVGAIGEALSVVYDAIVSPSENVALSESLATQAIFTVGLGESVTLSEALSAGLVFQLALSENIGAIGEALSVVLQARPALAETVTVGEAVAAQAVYNQGLPETVGLNESVQVNQNFQLALSETVTLSEAISVAKQFVVTLSETVAISEAVAAAAVYAANVSESVGLAEQVAVQLTAIVSLAEAAIALGESIDAHQGEIIPINLSETVALAEQVVTTIFRRTYELVALVSPGEFTQAIVLVPGQTSTALANDGVTRCSVLNAGVPSADQTFVTPANDGATRCTLPNDGITTTKVTS